MPAMNYVLSVKSLTAGEVPQDPTQPPAPAQQQPDPGVRQWSGDLYEEGDETAPEDAYSSFTAQDGSEAWLDHTPDGTLTGWVRTPEGEVYRYSDPNAWAMDVDGAEMVKQTGPVTEADQGQPPVDQQPTDGAELTDPAADENGAIPDAPADALAEDAEAAPADGAMDLSDPTDDPGEDPTPGDLGADAADDAEADDNEPDPADPNEDGEDDEDDLSDLFGGKKKGKGKPEFKSMSFRVSDTHRVVVTPR